MNQELLFRMIVLALIKFFIDFFIFIQNLIKFSIVWHFFCQNYFILSSTNLETITEYKFKRYLIYINHQFSQSLQMQNPQPTQPIVKQQTTAEQVNKIQIVPGQLWKIIHREGAGGLPSKGQQIFALYKGTLENGTEFDSNTDPDNPFKFNLGEGRVIKGWDQGFATMKKGEKATLICAPDFAYGKRGSPPRIPANATLHFEVELLDFQDKIKEKWELNDEQKLAEAQKAKNQGNQAFKQGDYSAAARLYNKGISFVEDDQGKDLQEILKVLRLNAAQSQIKLAQYSEAIKNCNKVLEKDVNNLKALYRRGFSYLKSQDFQKAQSDFENLLKLDPTNTDAQKQLQNVRIAEKSFREKEKKVFGNMFSRPLTEEKKKQQVSNKQQNKKKQETPKPQQKAENAAESQMIQQKSEQDKKND